MRDSNIILNDAAAPTNGISYGTIIYWQGGDISVNVSGVFNGAQIDVIVCNRLPDQSLVVADPDSELGQVETYAELFADSDWASLTSLTSPGYFTENLNPCLVTVLVANSGTNTRVKGMIG